MYGTAKQSPISPGHERNVQYISLNAPLHQKDFEVEFWPVLCDIVSELTCQIWAAMCPSLAHYKYHQVSMLRMKEGMKWSPTSHGSENTRKYISLRKNSIQVWVIYLRPCNNISSVMVWTYTSTLNGPKLMSDMKSTFKLCSACSN